MAVATTAQLCPEQVPSISPSPLLFLSAGDDAMMTELRSSIAVALQWQGGILSCSKDPLHFGVILPKRITLLSALGLS